MQSMTIYKHISKMHEYRCSILDMDLLFGGDKWFSYPRYMVKPKFDVIVVMPRGDLLSLLSFGLSAIYTHFFGIENGDLSFFINHLEFLQWKIVLIYYKSKGIVFISYSF